MKNEFPPFVPARTSSRWNVAAIAVGDLVTRLGISLASDPIREAMSARRPGRPLFGKVMQSLKEGEADAIVCWHPDRLARNPLDGGEIMWALSQGVIKEIVTPGRTFKNTSDDKLLLAIVFGMATKYTDDLSANVRRGNRQAIEDGRWPSKPPLGYKRAFDPVSGNRRHMPIMPDPERFDLREYRAYRGAAPSASGLVRGWCHRRRRTR